MKTILIFLICFGLHAEAQDLLSTHHLREQIDLSGVEISPDGKHILMLVSRQNYDSNDFLTELVMIDSRQQRTAHTQQTRRVSQRLHGLLQVIESHFLQLWMMSLSCLRFASGRRGAANHKQ